MADFILHRTSQGCALVDESPLVAAACTRKDNISESSETFRSLIFYLNQTYFQKTILSFITLAKATFMTKVYLEPRRISTMELFFNRS